MLEIKVCELKTRIKSIAVGVAYTNNGRKSLTVNLVNQ